MNLRRLALGPLAVVVTLVACHTARLAAQAASVSVVGEALHVRAPGFHFVTGAPFNHLRDGRSVRFDLELTVMSSPGTPTPTQSRRTFVLSYDLWEERFAITHTGAPPRSISHLTTADAEAWCIDRMTVPVAALGQLGRDVPFWIRLEYRVQDEASTPGAGDDSGYTIRGLIDRLSRRRPADEGKGTLEAGPFRIGN